MRYAISLLVVAAAATTSCTSFSFKNSGKGTAPSELMSKDTTMAKIPGGTFDMGAQEAEPDEYPPHKIEVSGFYMDKYEVTTGDYARCVSARVCRKLPEYEPDETIHIVEPQKNPVTSVSWYDAEKYCEWVGKRLPTEAEWEYAARAPKMNKFPFDAILDETRANQAGDKDGFARTAPVGSFPKGVSGYGLFDMSGNAAEWVADWYDAKWYDHSPGTNPKGPEAPTGTKVVRGGSWATTDYLLRSTSRTSLEPNISNDSVGFRCAAD